MYQTYSVPVVNGNAAVPVAEDLHYNFIDGVPQAGGFCIIGSITSGMKTVLVRIDASPEKHLELEANPEYLHVEEL